MPEFIDLKQRKWNVRILHADSVRVRKDTGVSLYHLLDKQMERLVALMGDPEEFVGVMYCLVQADAEKAGVEPEDFAGSIDGETLDAMGKAFLEALTDFFPNAEARKTLRQIIEKGKEVQAAMGKRADMELAALAALPAERILEQAIRSQTAIPSSEPSTSLPEKSAFAQTPTV